jgi:hypothetical protein
LQKTIASHEVNLSRSISINGLDEHTTRAVMTFNDKLSHGEDLKTAALSIAGYELPEIEAAMAQRDRDEMRAFDATDASHVAPPRCSMAARWAAYLAR